MLTGNDITFLVNTFVTKEEFNNLKEEIVTKDEHRKLFGMVESVFTEVKKMREEQVFHF